MKNQTTNETRKEFLQAIKLLVIMLTVLAIFSFINAIILANDIQNNPESYANARPCGQIKFANFINQIK